MGANIPQCGRRFFGLIGLALGFGSAAEAVAQDMQLSSMTERERQQQEKTGFQAGSFDIRPLFGAQGTYDDNVYSSGTNKRSDASLELRGEIAVLSRFSNHEVGARAWVDRLDYAKYTGENSTTYGGGLRGKLDVARTTALTLRADYEHLGESRLALNSNRNSDKRATYDILSGEVRLSREFNNFSIEAGGTVRDYRYDATRIAGVSVAQTFRNFTVFEASTDLVYGTQNATRIVAHGALEWRRYAIGIGDARFNPATLVDRSANGYRLEIGVQREITSLVQGTIRVGYLKYDYRDARIRNFSSFSYHGDLVWNVTPLTSLSASAERRLDETVSPTAAGNLRDEFRLGVQHELRRNVVLFGDARYAHVKLVDTTVRSNEFDVGAGARYFVGDNMVLTGLLRHGQRHSGLNTIDFNTNSATLSFKYLF